ncbi:tetratricopeptide repeat protein [Kitasatospora sp. NPDC058965]|uniref:tetratricopeptide repeat protein n=1 Tax=Kitasatospora sp. NPDC058965 TaxID=3346682 RepID=UPI0036A2F9C8
MADSLAKEAHELVADDRWADAEPLRRREIELRGRWLGPDSVPVLSSRYILALGLFVQRRREEVVAELLDLLPPFVAARGEDHPDSTHARMTLAVSLLALRRFHEAEEQYGRVLACHATVDDVRVKAGRLRAFALTCQGRHREAADALDTCLQEAAPVLGTSHTAVLEARISRINQLAVLAEHALVERECQDLLGTLDDQDPRHGRVTGVRVYQLNSTGRYAEAEAAVRKALTDHAQLPLHVGLARCLNGQARHEEALRALSDAQEHPRAGTADSRLLLATVTAQALLGLGRPEDAEGQARQAVDAAGEARYPPIHHRALEAAITLAAAIAAQGRPAEAEQHLTRCAADAQAHFGPDHPHTLAARTALAALRRS